MSSSPVTLPLLGCRHPSIPATVKDRVLAEFAHLHYRDNIEVPVRKDQPWITVEDLTFLPGRNVTTTIRLARETIDRCGLEYRTPDDQNLVVDGAIEFTFAVPQARLADVFLSGVESATLRWSPPTDGTSRKSAVVWSYSQDRRTKRWSRSGKALPVDPDVLEVAEYLQPPAGNKLTLAELLFYPAWWDRQTVPMAVAANGRRIFWDSAFPMTDDMWHMRHTVALVEDGHMIRAFPVPKGATEVPVEVCERIQALATIPRLELGPDEFQIGSQKANVWVVLEPYGITPESSNKEVKKAKRVMATRYHPDKWDAQERDFRASQVPDVAIQAAKAAFDSAFNVATLAFAKLEEVRRTRQADDESAGAGDGTSGGEGTTAAT